MPTYDYRCQSCNRKFDVFMSYSEYGQKEIHCPHCQSINVLRRIGRIRIAKSEEGRLEDLADPSKMAGMEDDPKALGKMMRQMSSETGEDLGPEFDEVVGRLEAGQKPEDIEKEVPDLGGGEGGPGMGMGAMGGGDFDDF
jgi:putative FmdB family regulatory protein